MVVDHKMRRNISRLVPEKRRVPWVSSTALAAGYLLALTGCTGPIATDPTLRSGYTAAQACNIYAAGLREATRRANSGDWTAEQDAVVDSVVSTYGPLCTPTVEPDAWRMASALVDTFASVGITVAEGR